MYNMCIKDLNKLLDQHFDGLISFFIHFMNIPYDMQLIKNLLKEPFADAKLNKIHFDTALQTNSGEMQKQRNCMKFKFIGLYKN